MTELWTLENEIYDEGYALICGVDEAGRGPLAGPVCAAAVILPRGTVIKGLNDSKKLTEKKREELFDEICRQAEVLERGEVVRQETRYWEAGKRRTVRMRVKEAADDYRMYPDPDLAPFDLSDEFVQRCRERMPELPDAKRTRYMADMGVNRHDATQIAGNPKAARLFEEAATLAPDRAETVANVVVNLAPTTRKVSAFQIARLSALLDEEAITFAQAREVMRIIDGPQADPQRVVDEHGMRQCTDIDALAAVVDEILRSCTDQVRQYHAGNKRVAGFLVGQCMKSSHGTGNPKLSAKFSKRNLRVLEPG